MIEARRDHACLYIELEDTNGILVTGGLGEDGQVLHTTEFYDVKQKKWTKTSSMKLARTEHVMALIYGIPTIIGGESTLNKNSFKIQNLFWAFCRSFWNRILIKH